MTPESRDPSSKRLFDLVVAASGLFLLCPLFILIAAWLRCDSPGPVFYRGKRVGRLGRVFYILKFRTMHDTARDNAGPRLTAQDDPRITRLGRWLRATKLNELPQLWNVLVGEMSMVGPRPEDPQLCDHWPEEVRHEVLSLRPGITSPASLLYRNEESLLHSDRLMETYFEVILPGKLRLDQRYVRCRSFWLDLDILLWTLWILFIKPRRFPGPREDQLFSGPFTRTISRFRSRTGGNKRCLGYSKAEF
jgi:lipopolysaccharide/colanic/teichoic acid biosynthesis glycosyltransferase